MSARELAELVARMRTEQKCYFKTRSEASLHESNRLEKLVDNAVDSILNPPDPGLFGAAADAE